METAVNLVQDGAPLFGECALVLAGVVGLLTASLLSEFPLRVVGHGLFRAAPRLIADTQHLSFLTPYSLNFTKKLGSFNGSADLTFELSGRLETLNDALAITGFSGRIVIGSWYGEKRAEIDLGGAFHRSRIKLISSQVSTVGPELSGRWNKARRFNAAWKALKRIKPEKWITHRFPIDKAEAAYRLLDQNPQETIQVLITY
jgi:threonine dehydrogenase-like Zn-dependent dehydrogenase